MYSGWPRSKGKRDTNEWGPVEEALDKCANTFKANPTVQTLDTYFREVGELQTKKPTFKRSIREKVKKEVQEWLADARRLEKDAFIDKMIYIHSYNGYLNVELKGKYKLFGSLDDLLKWQDGIRRVKQLIKIRFDIGDRFISWETEYVEDKLVAQLLQDELNPGFLHSISYDDVVPFLKEKNSYMLLLDASGIYAKPLDSNVSKIQQLEGLTRLLKNNEVCKASEEASMKPPPPQEHEKFNEWTNTLNDRIKRCSRELDLIHATLTLEQYPSADQIRSLKKLVEHLPFNEDNTKDIVAICANYDMEDEKRIFWRHGDQDGWETAIRNSIANDREDQLLQYVIRRNIGLDIDDYRLVIILMRLEKEKYYLEFEYDELVPLVKERHYKDFYRQELTTHQQKELARLLVDYNAIICENDENCRGFLNGIAENGIVGNGIKSRDDTTRLKELASKLPYNDIITRRLIRISVEPHPRRATAEETATAEATEEAEVVETEGARAEAATAAAKAAEAAEAAKAAELEKAVCWSKGTPEEKKRLLLNAIQTRRKDFTKYIKYE